MWRRRSPSVMMPTSVPSRSMMPTQPKPLADISTIASDIGVPSRRKRHRVAGMHDVAHEFEHARRAGRLDGSLPKSSAVKPRLSSSATASASPSAGCIRVEVVGARLCGQASRACGSTSTTSAARASVLSAAAVTAMSPMLKRRE